MGNTTKKILVLDDEQVVLDSVSRVLGEEGFEVETCQTAQRAMETLKQSKFHLLISDFKMPGIDGIEFFKEIKANYPDIPFVMITAYSDVESAREVMKLGAYDYIKKPFAPEQLSEMVKKIFQLTEQRDEEAYRKETFEEVKKAVSSTLSLRQALDNIVQGVVKTLKVKGATVSLLDKKSNVLRIGAHYGLSKEYVSKGPLDSSASIGDMVLSGEPVLIKDTSNDSRVQYPVEAQREGIASILSVPLLVKDHIIGALRVYSSKIDQFTDEDVDFLQGFAEHVAYAIENAQKFEDVKGEYNVLMDDLWEHFDKDGWL